MRAARLDDDGDRPGRGRIEDAPAATVTLTPFGMGRPQLKRLKGMARTQFAEWMARELTHRAGVRDGLVEGAQLPTPLPTTCRALRDLLRDMCPVVVIDGEAHLDFLTSQHEAGGEDVDSDQESDEEDQGQ